MNSIAVTTTPDTMNIGLRRSSPQASEARLFCLPRCTSTAPYPAPVGVLVGPSSPAFVGVSKSSSGMPSLSSALYSVIADPRVEHAVEQVDEQVRDNEHQHQ